MIWVIISIYVSGQETEKTINNAENITKRNTVLVFEASGVTTTNSERNLFKTGFRSTESHMGDW